MESKPPAACLGRKDNRSVFPWSFASIFIDQVAGERFVSHSERIYISYRQREWKTVRGASSRMGSRDGKEVWAPMDWEVHVQISGGSWGSMAPGCSLFWMTGEIATWKLISNSNIYTGM